MLILLLIYERQETIKYLQKLISSTLVLFTFSFSFSSRIASYRQQRLLGGC